MRRVARFCLSAGLKKPLYSSVSTLSLGVNWRVSRKICCTFWRISGEFCRAARLFWQIVLSMPKRSASSSRKTLRGARMGHLLVWTSLSGTGSVPCASRVSLGV